MHNEPTPSGPERHVVIVGGGAAGISVAARLTRALPAGSVTLIEPSSTHYYQPLWTLVGAGVVPKEVTARREASQIPHGVEWVRDHVTDFMPEQNLVRTATGNVVRYAFLVVAPGLQLNWEGVRGLPEAIGHGAVCSNYAYAYVDGTWETLRDFGGGTAIFTMPSTPIKCGGAPQKIMYLADDHFRRTGVRERSRIIFATGLSTIFSVKKYADALLRVAARKNIEILFQHNLVEVRSANKEAVFEDLTTGRLVTIPYDMMHVTPPMSAPDVVRRSPLANDAGWVEVDKHTLRHARYANIFGLGDASSLPTSKTGAAVRKQAPVVAQNLLAQMNGELPPSRYDGYTSCPLVTGYGKLILAEFDYDLTPRESFPFDQSQERRSMYWLKRYGLPALYWRGMLKGRA